MKTKMKPGPTGPGPFYPGKGPSETFSPGTYSIITLGCKSNQYDSAALGAGLEDAGMTRTAPAEAQVVVINTCMVTGPTEAQCRKAIRHSRRANPAARVIVAGCMSRGSRQELESMEEVDLVLDPADKGRLAEFLGIGDGPGWADWPEDPAVEPGDRDRGFLKVQDGCDAACTYCIVPSVRGRSRSLEPERVIGAVRKLMAKGAGEVVLSGIHLGHYGKGLSGGQNLEILLEKILDADLPGRVRLSSLEPLEITDRLIGIVAGASGRICRHIHIPLQSGSDRILAAMNRPYRRAQFAEAVARVKEAIDGVGIGCDVICGFPGESEGDYSATADLVDGLALPFVHAFPYSPRPGTEAYHLKDDVPPPVKKGRVAALTSLVAGNRIAFAKGFVGGRMEVAVESRTDGEGRSAALADNYLRVAAGTRGETVPGTLVEVTVTGVEKDLLVARTGS